MLVAALHPPALKLTAVVLAHMKNAKTGLLNPSVATVAGRVGISPSQAQRCIRELKAAGIVSVAANAHGGKPGTTPNYRLHLDRLPTGSAHATPTDRTHAAPTGGADAVPDDDLTGGAGAAEGQHPCAAGAAPMRPTGSAHAAQTGMNRKGTGKEPVLQVDAFEDGSPAAAGSQLKAQPAKRLSKAKLVAPTAATWNAYSSAFLARYGVDPLRNAKTNGQLANLVSRLGAEQAPRVAAFYVAHQGAYYAQRAHSVDALLIDAEKLRVEMLTGKRVLEPPRNYGGNSTRAPQSLAGIDYSEGMTPDGRVAA